jgi:hypothetical protein
MPTRGAPETEDAVARRLPHTRVAGALCALVFLIGVISAFAGTRSARLSDIQLGTNTQHVQQLVADPSVRADANRAIAIDYFFLATYWAAFTALAVMLGRRGGRWVIVAALAAATATATATFDIVENVRTSDVLVLYRSDIQLGQMQLDALRHVSLFKWGSAATTVALLAGLFVRPGKIALIGVALFIVAGIGFAGIAWHVLIEGYLLGIGALTLLIGIIFLAFPSAMTKSQAKSGGGGI